MWRPRLAGLLEARSRLPRDAVTLRAAVAAVVTGLLRAAEVKEQPRAVVRAADAVEQLRPRPAQSCPRIAVSRRR
jgi:hypothetical protein